jgi:hypothetical protein
MINQHLQPCALARAYPLQHYEQGRSIRPSSGRARSNWFWRWKTANRLSIADDWTVPVRNDQTNPQHLIPVPFKF